MPSSATASGFTWMMWLKHHIWQHPLTLEYLLACCTGHTKPLPSSIQQLVQPPPPCRKGSEGWNDWLMTGKVLRRQVISTVSSSVGYFNILCLCKNHNGTRHKLTLSQSLGTSWRDAGNCPGFSNQAVSRPRLLRVSWARPVHSPGEKSQGVREKPEQLPLGVVR